MGAKGTGKEFDKKVFENLCKIQCTLDEIAGVFETSPSTIRRFCKSVYNQPFESVYKMYASSGRTSLRRFQFAQAEKNPIMGIWLGKQYLGQTDLQNVRLLQDDEEDDLTKAIKERIKKKSNKTTQIKPKQDIDIENDDIDEE